VPSLRTEVGRDVGAELHTTTVIVERESEWLSTHAFLVGVMCPSCPVDPVGTMGERTHLPRRQGSTNPRLMA
jgi:hypothetical protein